MTAPQQTQQLTAAQAAEIAATLVAANTARNTVPDVVSQVSLSTAARISSITQATKNIVHGLWLQTNPYDNASVKDFTAQANQILVAAQQSTGKLAAAAQSTMLQSMGVKSAIVPVLDDDIRVPHATAATVSYQNPGDKPDTVVHVTPQDSTNESLLERPAKGFRWRESLGDSPEDARAFSITRLDDVVDGNLVIAQRDAEHQAINATGARPIDLDSAVRFKPARVIGYRRIIHPELSQGGVCGLCVAASDRVYRKEQLRPIHLRCHCTVAPVTHAEDPGQNLNANDLSRLYDDAGGSTNGASLKRTRYKVVNGELGPSLVPAPGETVPYYSTTPPPKAAESKSDIAARQLPGLEKSLADLRAQGVAEDSPQIQYHLKTIARFQGDVAKVSAS